MNKIHVFLGCLLLWISGCAKQSLVSPLYQAHPAFYSYVIGDIYQDHIHTAYQPDVYITPASCQKTLTALLAYKMLGADYQYNTTLWITRQGDKVQNIILSFSGDPTLTSDDLKQLLLPLRNETVTGSILLDRSIFQTPDYSQSWMIDDVYSEFTPPTSAINLDRNQVIEDDKPLALDVYITNKVAKILNELEISAPIEIVRDPGMLPVDRIQIGELRSPPLRDIIPPALKRSDNLVFDSLYLTLIHQQTIQPIRTWEEGDAWIKALTAVHLDLDLQDALIVDGSGVSRYNRLKTQQLFDVLRVGYTSPIFVKALAYPGEPDSSLERRTGLPPSIRAKTGSLGGISCLCGYHLDNHHPQAFVIVAQGFAPPARPVHQVIDNFIRFSFAADK